MKKTENRTGEDCADDTTHGCSPPQRQSSFSTPFVHRTHNLRYLGDNRNRQKRFDFFFSVQAIIHEFKSARYDESQSQADPQAECRRI